MKAKKTARTGLHLDERRLVMTKNMGSADRIVRILLAAAIVVLYLYEFISGTVAIVLGIFSVIFFLTSFIGFCPLYTILGIKTTGKDE